jgi:hypothetical protein
MDKHENCQDRCQIQEHKGYRSCGETSGECEELRAEIARLIPKAESGEQWAEICRLEAEIVARGEVA